MATDVIVATEIMRSRIDRLADSRESRDTKYGMGPGLGGGYYTEQVRSDAAAMAAAWLQVSNDDYGVTLDDLNAVTDIVSGALDAVQAARRRLSR
jgi:hypothetical protein